MRILVTGATGFIGSALCNALCRDGHAVAAFHRPTSYTGNISDLSLVRLTGDLTDADSVEQAVETFHPEVIFHLGAQMTAAPTVSRIMQELRAKGLLDYAYGKVTILDRSGLEKLLNTLE